MEAKFSQWECKIEFHRYHNNLAAILLTGLEDGVPICKATVNPEELISSDMIELAKADNCVFIKNYSENEGIFDSLVEAGVINKDIQYSFNTSHGGEIICTELLVII